MCGGGGGGGGNDFTYWANIQRDKDNEAANLAREQTAQAAADKAAAQSKFDAALATARTGAQGTAQRYFADRGLPFDQALVDSIIGRVNVPNLDANPASYFDPKVFEAGLNQSQDATRQRYVSDVNRTFAPGFERTFIPDTADDALLSSILGEQRGEANKILDYNKARGLLNDTGYNTAVNTLNQQEGAGRSTFNTLGDSVLGKFRQNLSDIRGEAGTAASSWNFGNPAPDFSGYYGRAGTKAASDLSGLEGSIRAAIGSTNVFDVPGAIAKGGTAQGPINLTTAAGEPNVTPGATRVADRKRGLGSTGVF